MLTQVKERPILMSTEMVKAIQDGRKTQTRRVIKNIPPREDGTQYDRSEIHGPEFFTPVVIDKRGYEQPGHEIFGIYDDYGEWGFKCPYGQPGDRLVLTSIWATEKEYDKLPPSRLPKTARVWTLYTRTPKPDWCGRTRIPRFVPKFLYGHFPKADITGIRAEQVQDISLGDISKEGIGVRHSVDWVDLMYKDYQTLWDSINAKRGYPWDNNDWVWVIEFKEIKL